MKFIIAIILSAFCLNAFAAFNEVECDGRNADSKRVNFSIEQGWGSSIRQATLLTYVQSGQAPEEERYRISSLLGRQGRMYYSGFDVRLEVDLFPDRTPRWGMRYRGTLLIEGNLVGNLSCSFPMARP